MSGSRRASPESGEARALLAAYGPEQWRASGRVDRREPVVDEVIGELLQVALGGDLVGAVQTVRERR